jgi:hypothetical protein
LFKETLSGIVLGELIDVVEMVTAGVMAVFPLTYQPKDLLRKEFSPLRTQSCDHLPPAIFASRAANEFYLNLVDIRKYDLSHTGSVPTVVTNAEETAEVIINTTFHLTHSWS